MSYPMVHLQIAYGLLERCRSVERRGDFLLGSVAPDAVHFRDPYEVSLKEKSHLWKFGPRWGVTLDHAGWRKAIFAFWEGYKKDESRDFVAGYCVHLLTDWENDRRIWTPFRENMMQETEIREIDEIHRRYAAEAYGIDQWLYQTSGDSKEIWRLLEQGQIYDIEGCILKEDLERQKRSILNEQFIGKETLDVSGYRFCTKEAMEAFVRVCVEEISREIEV